MSRKSAIRKRPIIESMPWRFWNFASSIRKPMENISSSIAGIAIKNLRNNSKSRKESTIKRDNRRFVRGENFIERLIQKSTLPLIRLTFQGDVPVKLKQVGHILRSNG